jgi:hypothetical protein
MRLTIELTPEQEVRLRAAAREAGLDAAECARQVLTAHLPALPAGEATRDLLRTWQEEDATDDPEEIRKAEEELTAFKQGINAVRAEAGARILYP